jgi:energy-coupling factor transporter ATP-binding protein EcfA2
MLGAKGAGRAEERFAQVDNAVGEREDESCAGELPKGFEDDWDINEGKGIRRRGRHGCPPRGARARVREAGWVPKTKVANRIDKGKAKYKLQFAGATSVALEEILSEGEQRAMAIGSFLAELWVAGHKGAIVFDDPVSSLDHQRKRQIAKRLGEESKVRQAIVFTHDLPFLALLVEEVEDAKAEYVTHWLERDGSGSAGRVKLNDCPAESPEYRSTKLGRASIEKAKKISGSEAVLMLRQAAGQLRRTIEEVVQEYLFKDVIARWRENLMVTKVKLINWDNAVADEIDSLFAELSRVFEGHSHSGAYAGGTPEVADLLKLADRIDKVIVAAKKPRG